MKISDLLRRVLRLATHLLSVVDKSPLHSTTSSQKRVIDFNS